MRNTFVLWLAFLMVACGGNSPDETSAKDSGSPAKDAGAHDASDAAKSEDGKAPGTGGTSGDGSTPDAKAPLGPFPSEKCSGTNIVNVSPSDDSAAIQAKIDGAPSGATICFASGHYDVQGLKVHSGLSLQGDGGPELAPINGDGAVFDMQPSPIVENVSFSGFKFAGRGFFISGGHSLSITACLFQGPIVQGSANSHYIYFNMGPTLTLTNSTFVGRYFDPSIGSDHLDACIQGYGGKLDFNHLSFRGCAYDSMHLLGGPYGTISYSESLMTPSLNFEIQGGASPNGQGLKVHHNHVFYPVFLSTTDETKNYNLFGMSIPADQSQSNEIYSNVLDYSAHPSAISGEREGIEVGGHDSSVHDNQIDVPSGVPCVVAAKGWNISIFDNYCSASSKPYEGEPGPGPGTYGNVSNNGSTTMPSFAPESTADDVREQAGNPLDGRCVATDASAPAYFVAGDATIPVVCK